ncbi:hypothetical protein F4780DRAFT_58787 [Xylariomycetidae sp. FL0641]|nr:hypothetical protein F4780DRAFT_58787 [Xylariomycetidae sp. FL0641]
MSGLPEGWESDYDGSRWFYKYKPTGEIQYHFPRDGDEFPEFIGVGLGHGPLKPRTEARYEPQTSHEIACGGKYGTNTMTKENGRKSGCCDDVGMSATGYFDPAMFFSNGVSPTTDEGTHGEREQTAINTESQVSSADLTSPIHEQPPTAQRTTFPVGYMAELATGDTVKCAEELAPIEMDATSYMPVVGCPTERPARAVGSRPREETMDGEPPPSFADTPRSEHEGDQAASMSRPARWTTPAAPEMQPEPHVDLLPGTPPFRFGQSPVPESLRIPGVPTPTSTQRSQEPSNKPSFVTMPASLEAPTRPRSSPVTSNDVNLTTPSVTHGLTHAPSVLRPGGRPLMPHTSWAQGLQELQPSQSSVGETPTALAVPGPSTGDGSVFRASVASTAVSNSTIDNVRPGLNASPSGVISTSGGESPSQVPALSTHVTKSNRPYSIASHHSSPGQPQSPFSRPHSLSAISHTSSPIAGVASQNQSAVVDNLVPNPTGSYTTGKPEQKMSPLKPYAQLSGPPQMPTQYHSHQTKPSHTPISSMMFQGSIARPSPQVLPYAPSKPSPRTQGQPPPATMQAVSRPQSQVPSPTQSIASMQRPPSTVSSISTFGSQQVVGLQSPAPTSAARPPSLTATAPAQQQGSTSWNDIQMAQQPPSAQNLNPSKPFPLRFGQVTTLASQIGPNSVAVPIQLQSPATSRPSAASPQQQTSAHFQDPPTPNTQIQPSVQTQTIGHSVQTSSVQQPTQQAANVPRPWTPVQNQLPQPVQSPPLIAGAPGGSKPQHTMPTSSAAGQGYAVPQNQGNQLQLQGKPVSSTQATAATTGAGKGVKKWAKKVWSNPALKQTTAMVGGAIFAESMGVSGAAGAALGNQIYTSSQARPPENQPPRPPSLVYAQTLPAQSQGTPAAVPRPPNTQAAQQAQMWTQSVSIQTPGRPPVVQNSNIVQIPGPPPVVQSPNMAQYPERPWVVQNQNMVQCGMDVSGQVQMGVNINAQAQVQARASAQQQQQQQYQRPPQPMQRCIVRTYVLC